MKDFGFIVRKSYNKLGNLTITIQISKPYNKYPDIAKVTYLFIAPSRSAQASCVTAPITYVFSNISSFNFEKESTNESNHRVCYHEVKRETPDG